MKKFLCGLLSAALAVSLTVPMAGAAYTDVPSESTLGGEVEKAVRYGLMNGYSDTTFGYGDSMTRAQFAAVLVRMMGWETVTPATADFTDVPVSHTWYGAVETAAAHDVVDEGGAFRPGDAITRGEMSEMLVRALGLKATAEMAASLAKLPTAHRSTRVYRDWSRLAPMIGRANSSSWRTSGPWVRSRIVLDLACSSIKNLPYHRKVM